MRSSTVKNLTIASFYALALILGMILGPKFSKENNSTKNGSFMPFFGEGRVDKIDRVLKIIQDKYVDPVKTDSLQKLAISEILKRLDPHSTYLAPSESNYLNQDLEGSFYGIGIEYHLVNDTVLVTGVTIGGPAQQAGIKAGDRIVKIDNRPVSGKGIEEGSFIDLVRGRAGTRVNLLTVPVNTRTLKTVSVKRDKIIISSIDVAYMLNKQTGYIRISRFGTNTDKDFTGALSRLQKHGMHSLVLDLRKNGGGYLNAATAIADQFLPDKKLIVYTKGSHEPRTDYFATSSGFFEKGKLVVLIDENTASASEIVAGAVQDLDRGIIIGRRSYGKGLVQEQFNFGDGSSMNLTVARYYTPSGRSIQKPYKKGNSAYYHELNERYLSGELKSNGHVNDTVFDKNKAYKTSGGRLMYAGGGIMPDIYVPIDTTAYTDFYYELNEKGILDEFLFKDLVKGNVQSSPEKFIESFNLNAKQYDKIVSLASAEGIKADPETIEITKAVINTELKALIGRYYFGNEMFYKVQNASDKVIARSLEILK